MSTPNIDNPDNDNNHEQKFSQIERELLSRGGAATYFAATLAGLPNIPEQVRREAQYFLWFGRMPINVDINGRAKP